MNSSNEYPTTTNQYMLTNVTSTQSWTTYIYMVFYITNPILGVPVNSYVLWLIFSRKGCDVVSDFFTLNLAVCDMTFCLGGLSFAFASSFPNLYLWLFFLTGLHMTGRPLFHCLICVERYIAVLHPVIFLKMKPLRYRLAGSLLVWLTVTVFCVFCMFTLYSFDMHLFICVILPQYFLFLSVKMFCCLAIVRALTYPGPGHNRTKSVETNQRKRKAITVILIITVAMFFHYSPLFLVGFLYDILSKEYFDLSWSIVLLISLFSGYVKPFLYICRAQN